MGAKTQELRAAHDVPAGSYAGRLAGTLDHKPIYRALPGPFQLIAQRP